MIVLGLNAYGHDSAAVLLVDGRAAFAASEERRDRVRHSGAFPVGAIEGALRHAGLSPSEVDVVAVPWTRGMARVQKAWHVLRHWPRSRAFLQRGPSPSAASRQAYLAAMAGLSRQVRAIGLAAPIERVPHHRAHAVSAGLAFPEREAAVLTADGMGEWTTTAAWRVRDGQATAIARQVFPHSAGKAYAAVTSWLGFRPEADEGKTMGLAAHGRPDAPGARFTRTLLRPDPQRILRVLCERFSFPWGDARMWGGAFLEALGPPRDAGAPLRPGDADAARGIQDALEDVFLAAARRLVEQTGLRALGLAGGVFLNCSLNGRLARELDVEVRPFPVGGDAGAAWGAAVAVHRRRTGRAAEPLETLRLGHDLTAEEAAALGVGEPVAPGHLPEVVADRIARGRLVGVARGRAEFGPRALGGRSILGTPRRTEDRDRLNAHKGRESWRPLAPVVRRGDPGWFEGPAESPWMILTLLATAAARERVPGAVHVDGTARTQTVSPEGEPFLHAALEALARRGHPPVFLNTSLNRPGEPIADTAAQALAAARAMALDDLVLADRLVTLSALHPG